MDKRKKAMYSVFASQHLLAFREFCQENEVEPDLNRYDLIQAFYLQRDKAKEVNKDLKTRAKSDRRLKRRMLSTSVSPSQVVYNKGFNLIDGDCLHGQQPVSDKTQVREGEYLTIQ